MSKKASTYLISILVLLAFIASVIFIYFSILDATNGNFVYPIDDTYIHLSIAKHWLASGLPGINNGEFVFLTSSPLWTAIIAAFAFLGINSEMLPFYINMFLAIVLILYLIHLFLPRFNNRTILLFIILLIIYSTSIPLLVIMGMEHLLHILLLLVLFMNADKFFQSSNKSELFGLYILVALLPLIRYESLFAIGAIVLLLLIRKKFIPASIVLLISILPIVLVGLYSLGNGGTFLPTSLLLKGEFFDVHSLKELIKTLVLHPIHKLKESPQLLFILIASIVLLFRNGKKLFKTNELVPLLVFIITFVLHLLFAKIGWLYRYEAYLILIGSVTIALGVAGVAKLNGLLNRKVIIFILLLLSFSLLFRAYDTNTKIKQASINIYEQQWQMADFIKEFYSGNNIAINDIGLISYRANVNICDLWGLASHKIAALKMKKQLNMETINSVLERKQVNIAVLYTLWFQGEKEFYKQWLEAGSWIIKNNVVCGDSKVTFFAKDSVHLIKLEQNLNKFSSSLPKSVIQKINTSK